MIDAAIRSKRIITPQGMIDGAILVKDGNIAEVIHQIPEGDFPVTDLDDFVLMPGVVDPHVHINEPGRADWEGFDTATRSALAGGITTMVEMPLNASPVTTNVSAFEKKIQSAERKLHMDCGFWGGVIPGNEKEIEPLLEKGVLGFKAFLVDSGIDEFPPVTEKDLRKAMPLLAKYDLPLLVHCELESEAPLINSTRNYDRYLGSRPGKWEKDAIALMIKLCEEFHCRVHIVHLSFAGALDIIARAKEKGLPITVETAQHYLFFSSEEIPEGATAYKCAPPIREKGNNEELWQALKSGLIDFVATDHSPAPPELKEIHTGDLMKAWGGIASIQVALPALWTAARQHNASLTDMAKWLCSSPALLPQLKNKGRIEKGCNADIVAWSPEEKFILAENDLHHKHKISPYLGKELYGTVLQTWLRGEKLYDDGKFLHLNKGRILYHE